MKTMQEELLALAEQAKAAGLFHCYSDLKSAAACSSAEENRPRIAHKCRSAASFCTRRAKRDDHTDDERVRDLLTSELLLKAADLLDGGASSDTEKGIEKP